MNKYTVGYWVNARTSDQTLGLVLWKWEQGEKDLGSVEWSVVVDAKDKFEAITKAMALYKQGVPSQVIAKAA